ncbi:MAG: hypothetical protein IJO71_09565 [Microbacterium sp.]|uniref:hypothetical protein n=1 Tax=Microbacterium sp. TaxID=51671 RepID=UPI0025F48933|nr:hypothetical protein [Microbacterium sp.]MBQ9917429.1 hypothetical protein [Microbacterium sp.]
MAPLNPFKKKGSAITAQLAAKKDALDNLQGRESAAARTYADLSATAAQKSQTAETHSAAVTRALNVLAEAGVE